MKPALAAAGSATVAVLSQSSRIAAIFAMRRGHVVYNNCALDMLLYKQCLGFYCCSKRVVYKREVSVLGTPSSCLYIHADDPFISVSDL